LSEKLRLVVISVSCRQCWIHLSTLSEFAGPLQFRVGHSYVTPYDEVSDANKWFREVVESEIAPLLDEYWFDAPKRAEDAVRELLVGL
jgi:hypothetical protein